MKSIYKKGMTIFGKKNKDELLVNPLFERAKKGDADAAVQLIQELWTEDKTQELRRLILPERPPIFFSVPGTSRLNQVPIAYARFLAQQTQEYGSTYLVGDEYISSLHTSMMKSVKNGNRLMSPRLYEPFDETFFDRLRHYAESSQIILVEDVLTTGSSVNTFRRFLEHNDIPVSCIIGVKGDTDICPTLPELTKLEKLAKKAGIDTIDWIALGQELTRSELTALTFQYIGDRYKRADEPLRCLMRRQLYYLSELKTKGRYCVAHKIEDLSILIDRREKKR